MILTDNEILQLCNAGQLIATGFEPDNVSGCTYEFQVSSFAHRYDYEHRSTVMEESESHVIYPFESVVIVTMEKLNLGPMHYLDIHLKGSLFALGIVPVCTAADPGFSNYLGITLTNLSARPVVLKKGMRFAKGTFHLLNARVAKPYTGQHGDARMSWPYPTHMHGDRLTYDQYSAHFRRFLPSPFAAALQFLREVGRFLWIIFGLEVVALACFIIAIFSQKLLAGNRIDALFATLNLIGAVASIISIVMTGVMAKRSDNDR